MSAPVPEEIYKPEDEDVAPTPKPPAAPIYHLFNHWSVLDFVVAFNTHWEFSVGFSKSQV